MEQWLARMPHKHQVEGSNPSPVTIRFLPAVRPGGELAGLSRCSPVAGCWLARPEAGVRIPPSRP
jgi:hypothetical protein